MSTSIESAVVLGIKVKDFLRVETKSWEKPQWDPNTGKQLPPKTGETKIYYLFDLNLNNVYRDSSFPGPEESETWLSTLGEALEEALPEIGISVSLKSYGDGEILGTPISTIRGLVINIKKLKNKVKSGMKLLNLNGNL